jgi:hypothetical protein
MYETVAKLASAHEIEIASEIARVVKTHKIAWFSQLSSEELERGVLMPLRLTLEYLQSTDLAMWRRYCARITVKQSRNGVDDVSLIKVGDCIIIGILHFLNQESAALVKEGLSPEKVIQNVQRRLQGLKMVGSAVINSTSISQKVAEYSL